MFFMHRQDQLGETAREASKVSSWHHLDSRHGFPCKPAIQGHEQKALFAFLLRSCDSGHMGAAARVYLPGNREDASYPEPLSEDTSLGTGKVKGVRQFVNQNWR